jgi:amino acid permease
LANNEAGPGILTLVAGKASGTGWIPSILTCVALAFCSAHTYILIVKACEMTGETTFKGLWDTTFFQKDGLFGRFRGVFLQWFNFSSAFFIILGSSATFFQRDEHSKPWMNLQLPARLMSRTGIIALAATCTGILWPLNRMIRDLSAMGLTSILGLCAVLYTLFTMVVRALNGTCYSLGNLAIGQAVRTSVVDGAITPSSFPMSTLWNVDFKKALVLVMSNVVGLAGIYY